MDVAKTPASIQLPTTPIVENADSGETGQRFLEYLTTLSDELDETSTDNAELLRLCMKLKTVSTKDRPQALDDLVSALFHTDTARRPSRATDGPGHNTARAPAHYGRTRKILGKRASLYKKCQQLYAANKKWLTDRI